MSQNKPSINFITNYSVSCILDGVYSPPFLNPLSFVTRAQVKGQNAFSVQIHAYLNSEGQFPLTYISDLTLSRTIKEGVSIICRYVAIDYFPIKGQEREEFQLWKINADYTLPERVTMADAIYVIPFENILLREGYTEQVDQFKAAYDPTLITDIFPKLVSFKHTYTFKGDLSSDILDKVKIEANPDLLGNQYVRALRILLDIEGLLGGDPPKTKRGTITTAEDVT